MTGIHDDFRLTEARDAADDRLLDEQDRAEHQAWLEGQAEDVLEHENRERDVWGPNPADAEPWEPIAKRPGRDWR